MSASHQVISYWDIWVVYGLMLVNMGVNFWRYVVKGDMADDLRMHSFAAAAWLVVGIINFVNRDWTAMWLSAFWMALELYKWWRKGGGKNTKRRLKKLKEKFVGQRRTAPQTA